MTYSPNGFNKYSGSAKAIGSNFQNGMVSGLAFGTPVALNTSSQITMVDVSDELLVQALVGVTAANIPSGATGTVMDAGRLENLTTVFAYGDPVYIAKNGMLTNVKPDIGVGGFTDGDFVVFVGVIVKNEFNPAWKDLKLMISVIGQL